MKRFRILEYESSPEEWDAYVHNSNNGTIFHEQRFLQYHGDRFKGKERYLAIYKNDSLFALFSLAVTNSDLGDVANSPFGASYGGPVFRKIKNYEDSAEIVRLILEWAAVNNIVRLTLTNTIFPLVRSQSDTFNFAMLEKGFVLANRDISSIVCLDKNNHLYGEYERKNKEMARKSRRAKREGVVIVDDGPLDDFLFVQKETFEKLGITPTHSYIELKKLKELYPECITFPVAYLGDRPISALGLFKVTSEVLMAFYILNSPKYRQLQGLTCLFHMCIESALNKGNKWFDLGTSSTSMRSNVNLFRFKESLGAAGFFRDTFVWNK